MYIYIEYICLCTSTIIHNLTYIYHILYEYIIHHYICLKCTNRLTSRIEVSSEMRAKSNGGGSLETTFEAWEKFAKRLGRFGMFFFWVHKSRITFCKLVGNNETPTLESLSPRKFFGCFFLIFRPFGPSVSHRFVSLENPRRPRPPMPCWSLRGSVRCRGCSWSCCSRNVKSAYYSY